jgi:hypothetical protein
MSCLNDFLRLRLEKDNPRVLNFLDIPMAHRVFLPPRLVFRRYDVLRMLAEVAQHPRPQRQSSAATVNEVHVGDSLAGGRNVLGACS